MLDTIKLAAKFLWREWRAGEWLVVTIALIFAITATTGVHFFTDRFNRGLDQQGAKFLGGDLAISSAVPLSPEFRQHALAMQLKTTEVWAYPSVASNKDHMQLVNLQAVADNYPLIGDSNNHPQLDSVWVEPRLLSALGIAMNGQLTIGAKQFRVSRLLTGDIDSLNTGWAIAPRLMMRLADVPATHTVLPGSRVDYRLLITGEKHQLQLFRQWAVPHLTASQRLLDVAEQQSSLRKVLVHAQQYMELVLLGCLLMSGVAIALSVQQYMRRHYGHVALWRCLGARQLQIRKIIFLQLAMIAIVAGIIGVMCGYTAQMFFGKVFNEYLQFPLPPVSSIPALVGLLTSVLLLFVFAFPAVWDLPNTPPVYLWRNQIISKRLSNSGYLLFAFLIVAIVVYVGTDFSSLTLNFLILLFISIAILYGISVLFLKLIRKIVNYTDGVTRRGLNQLLQYASSFHLQFIGFTLILTSLLILYGVRTHLITNWQQSLPVTTPNYFAINIAPEDVNNIFEFFKRQHIHIDDIYPMIRGRLTQINDSPVMSAVPVSAQNNNALHRELNLSFMLKFPSDNKIVKGHSWGQQAIGKALVSVEEELAKNLNIHLGDKLTFQIGERSVSAVVDSFRKLDWTSFHPNFFMIFPPNLLIAFPMTYITSFHLAAGQEILLNQVVQTFPNVTVIDVAALLQEMQSLIAKVTLAIQYLFLFAFGDGVLIFLTCLQASMDERKQTYGLLRVLGASQKYIRNSLLVEFTSFGAMILVSAGGIAYIFIWLLEKVFFNA
jgi:putative ABC transport system permease protein